MGERVREQASLFLIDLQSEELEQSLSAPQGAIVTITAAGAIPGASGAAAEDAPDATPLATFSIHSGTG